MKPPLLEMNRVNIMLMEISNSIKNLKCRITVVACINTKLYKARLSPENYIYVFTRPSKTATIQSIKPL